MKTTCPTVLLAMVIAAPAWTASHTGIDHRTSDSGETLVERVQQDKPQDVAGTWALTVETAQGSGTPSVTLKQDGEKLTGTYSSQVFGEQQVTGSMKGSGITFTFTASIEGNTLTVTYSGTVEKDTMKGKVTLGDLGEGTFTGKKK